MVVAPIGAGRESELRDLLARMNLAPGRADPSNDLVPFGTFDRIHFVRFVILDDLSINDLAVYGRPPVSYPLALAFIGDCDGDARTMLADLAARAEPGLRRIFSCCGLGAGENLAAWMRARNRQPAALYLNRPGRAVRHIREDADVCRAIERFVDRERASLAGKDSREVHAIVRKFLMEEVRTGRVPLTPEPPTPVGWRLRQTLHAVSVPLVLLLLAPLLLVYLPILAFQLRSREKADPEIVPRVDPAHARRLAALEDYDVTNQFSAFGSLKPGLFRRWLLVVLLWLANYATRHIYVRGRLGRVHTIHAARWVFLNEKRRVFFASNYDGSLESYMDDFINKVGWGLNLVFSNGIGYPSTRWLVLGGAKNEQKFKDFIRRHELPTEVWYNGHAGMTTFEIERHHRVRKGVEAETLPADQALAWCRLI
jgi:hypothetical protein